MTMDESLALLWFHLEAYDCLQTKRRPVPGTMNEQEVRIRIQPSSSLSLYA